MKVSFTGHRPNKLGGWSAKQNTTLIRKMFTDIEALITEHGADTFITGMALGVDIWAARCVIKLREKYPHIKLVCAVPCKRQWAKWNDDAKREWQFIIESANHVYYVTETTYTNRCMQLRNEWMVNHSDTVFAVWDGTPSGTGNCVKYAQAQGRRVHHLDPRSWRG